MQVIHVVAGGVSGDVVLNWNILVALDVGVRKMG